MEIIEHIYGMQNSLWGVKYGPSRKCKQQNYFRLQKDQN